MVDSLFIAIWTGALLLAAAALSLFAAMLVRRWLGGYWARRSTRLAMELAETLIVQMEAGALPSTRLRALIRHPRRTALAVIELSALVRGRDFERAMVALREVRAARRISRLLDKPGLDTRLMAIEAIGIVGGAGARRALQRAFGFPAMSAVGRCCRRSAKGPVCGGHHPTCRRFPRSAARL